MVRTGGPSALGFSYTGRDPALLARVLPLVDVIEVAPDDLVWLEGDDIVLQPDIISDLQAIGADATIVVHGVGLSIGSFDGWCETYLRLLGDLMARVDIAWHSEHLGYTTVEGEFLGTMLPLPRTTEALDMVGERVVRLRERLGLPFLVENVVGLLPDPGGTMSEAGFLNTLTREAGCGLLLDVYNLQCDEANHALDVDAFLSELDLDAVGEVHVANGVKRRGFQLDVHSGLTAESTIALAHRALASGAPLLTYELLPQAVPILGYGAIEDELTRLRSALTSREAVPA
jgi:uncharacterized protein (UPF0276 family)